MLHSEMFLLIKNQEFSLKVKDLTRRVSYLFLKGFLLFVISIFNGNISHAFHPIEIINSTETIDSLNDLAWEHLNSDLEKFNEIGEKALKESKRLNYLFGECQSYQILGTYYFNIRKLDSSLIFYEKALQKRVLLGDSIMISGSLNNIANVYKVKGDYKEALDLYNKANEYISNLNYRKKARLHSNISAIYTQLGDYSNALHHINKSSSLLSELSIDSGSKAQYKLNEGNIFESISEYEKALELFQEASLLYSQLGNEIGLAKTKNNIGNIYLKKGKIDEAIKIHLEVLDYYKIHHFLIQTAGIEHNLAIAYSFNGDFHQSETYFKSSITKWEEIGNEQKQAEVLVSLGTMYLSKGTNSQAIKVFLEAESLLPTNAILLSKLYNFLSLSYGKLGKHNIGYSYQLKYMSVKDSIENENFHTRNLVSQIQKNKKNILLNDEKRKREKILKYFLIIFSILFVLLNYSYIQNWKSKKKFMIMEKTALEKQYAIENLLKDQELISIRNVLEVQEKERKRIAQDLHDRLGSMLSMTKLHFQNVNNNIAIIKNINQQEYDKANKLLDDACNEIRSIAHNLSSGVLKNFGLVAAVKELKNTLVDTKKYDVELIIHQFDKRIHSNYELTIYRIIQELISNILRHADANEISIQLLRKKDYIHASIEDNGKGFDSSLLSNKSGMGLKNIKSRIFGLNGTFNIDSQKGRGTLTFFEIPINQNQ